MGLDNLKVEVKVSKKGVEKLIDAVVDTFSPATETLGLLGDAVRLARIEVAAAITRKAKVIADERGLKLTAPPLKFLVPFFEKASIEDLSDDTLVAMWARLLMSAGSKFEARQMRYSTILSEMSSEQAHILQGIARNYGGVIGLDVDQDALFYELAERRLVSTLQRIDEKEPDAILARVLGEIGIPGVCIVHLAYDQKPDGDYYEWAEDEVYSDERSVDLEILRSVGLIDRVATDFIELKHVDLTVTFYHMTELGFDFWSSCCGVPKSEDVLTKGA
jgi:hypothetical protein